MTFDEIKLKSIKLKPQKIVVEGEIHISASQVDNWRYKSCTAECGVGDDWATLYCIESGGEGKGHATALLLHLKEYYEKR